MLTAIDQPLDKLDNLTPEEMCDVQFILTNSRLTWYHLPLSSVIIWKVGLAPIAPLNIIYVITRLDGPLLKQVHCLWQARRKWCCLMPRTALDSFCCNCICMIQFAAIMIRSTSLGPSFLDAVMAATSIVCRFLALILFADKLSK